MLPGTMRDLVIPKIEASSQETHNEDFFVAYNPEFLRESTAVNDFNHPPKTVVGADSDEIAERVMSLFDDLPGPKIKTEIEIAEMVKYVDNNFHALKITFANEIGRICKEIGLDSHKVMDIFMQDTKLNISRAYLKPGFAFGGSCLPKDLRAISYLAKLNDLETPVLNAIIPSNNVQIINAIKRIMQFDRRKIGIAGFSFKEGTDDLSESPVIEVIETLIGKGYDLKLYDKNISMAKLIGANKEYINFRIPHISSLMVESIEALMEHSEIIVIGTTTHRSGRLWKRANRNKSCLIWSGSWRETMPGQTMMEFAGKKILIIVENLPSPFDRRVWQEATALRDNGATVSIICPTGKGYEKKI
jgi:GDP-mannose 6-dehydrogenase